MTPRLETEFSEDRESGDGVVPFEVEAAAWLFEQIIIRLDSPVDRPRIRRALEQAVLAWPDDAGQRWWRWFAESCHSLGLTCKVVDCTLDELLEIARAGGMVVSRHDDQHPWLAITGSRRRKLEVLHPLSLRSVRWLSARRLRREINKPEEDAVVRCVVLDSPRAGRIVDEDSAETRTPLSRLLALLKPESADLWMILVFALVAGLLTMATPLAVEALVSTVSFGRLLQPVVILALMLFAFLAFSAALQGLQTWVVEIIQRRLFARVAADLAFRLPRVRAEALDGRSGPELVNRFFEVVTLQKATAQLMLDGVTLVLSTLTGMAVLGFYHPWLLGFDVVLLALIAFGIFVLGRGAVATSIKESKAKYHMASWLEDLAGCTTAFRADGAAEFALERTDQVAYDYLSARKSHFRVLMRQIVFALCLQVLASTVLLGLGGWLVISGQLTLGQLVAAELIVTIIVGSFAKLGKHIESFYDLLASVDKLGTLFDLRMEKQDGLLRMSNGGPAQVAVNSVSYLFPDETLGLPEISLEVGAGEHCAVTGSSGTGKSTLLDLLFGVRSPSAGHLAINDTDPRNVRPDVLRRHVALVRDVEVFEGSIAENVHLERPDVSDADLRDALERVGLLDGVLKLPEGVETQLAAGGRPLSTNQIRKLMIARAIASRPNLLLVDGTLDPLPDDEAEDLVRMLTSSPQPWTLILVTGRESLAELCSQRVRLDTSGREFLAVGAAEGEVHHAE